MAKRRFHFAGPRAADGSLEFRQNDATRKTDSTFHMYIVELHDTLILAYKLANARTGGTTELSLSVSFLPARELSQAALAHGHFLFVWQRGGETGGSLAHGQAFLRHARPRCQASIQKFILLFAVGL